MIKMNIHCDDTKISKNGLQNMVYKYIDNYIVIVRRNTGTVKKGGLL